MKLVLLSVLYIIELWLVFLWIRAFVALYHNCKGLYKYDVSNTYLHNRYMNWNVSNWIINPRMYFIWTVKQYDKWWRKKLKKETSK